MQLNGQNGKHRNPIAELERIKPIDCLNGERWYEIIDRGRTTYCRGVNMILRQLAPAPALMEWIKTHGANADTIRDRRAHEGRQVHWAVEALEKGQEIKARNYPSHVWKAILSYARWKEDHGPHLLGIERTVFSTKHLLAGTLDQLNDHDGELRIDDVKFTKYIYEDNFRQVQTYAALARLMGIPVERVGIVQVGAKTKQGYSYRTQKYDPRVFDELVVPLLEVNDFLLEGRTRPILEQLPEALELPGKNNSEKNGKEVLTGNGKHGYDSLS